MFDDDSDLTDIEDSHPSTQRQAARNANANTKGKSNTGYQVKNALKPPRTTSYTAKALYDQMYQGDIDVDPEYQRGVVWPDGKQIGIIDSMFRNFYIPPIIFAVNRADDGVERRVCIDGKQRLTSILRFMDGAIPRTLFHDIHMFCKYLPLQTLDRDTFTGDKLWFKETSAKKSKDKILPERYTTLFQNKQVVCVEYDELSPENEREIFQRVQMGMALMIGEKLQGISGPWPTLVRELQEKYLSDTGLVGQNLDWDRSRGRDFQTLAQCIYTIDNYPTQKSVGTAPQIDKWLHTQEPPEHELTAKLHDTFRVFLDLARHKSFSAVLKEPTPRIAPIEFIMVSLLISVHKQHFSLEQLSKAIAKMRKHVRDEHVDIRSNSKVFKTLLDFIKGLKPSQFAGDGPPAAAAPGGKRKRAEQDDEEAAVRSPRDPYRLDSSKGKLPSRPAPRFSDSQPQSQGYVTLPPKPIPTPSSHPMSLTAPPPPRLAALRAAKALSAGTGMSSPSYSEGYNSKPQAQPHSQWGEAMILHSNSSNHADSRRDSPQDAPTWTSLETSLINRGGANHRSPVTGSFNPPTAPSALRQSQSSQSPVLTKPRWGDQGAKGYQPDSHGRHQSQGNVGSWGMGHYDSHYKQTGRG